MWKKLAAMVSASLTVASCQTAMYKPIICKPGTALREGRCQKVPAFEKRQMPPVAKKNTVKPKTAVDAPDPIQAPRRMNEYGQPI